MKEHEIFRRLLKKQMEPGDLRDRLEALKVRPTYENGILFQMVKKAADGDLTATKYVLAAVREETAPEGPDLSQVPTEVLRRMAGGGIEMQNAK